VQSRKLGRLMKAAAPVDFSKFAGAAAANQTPEQKAQVGPISWRQLSPSIQGLCIFGRRFSLMQFRSFACGIGGEGEGCCDTGGCKAQGGNGGKVWVSGGCRSCRRGATATTEDCHTAKPWASIGHGACCGCRGFSIDRRSSEAEDAHEGLPLPGTDDRPSKGIDAHARASPNGRPGKHAKAITICCHVTMQAVYTSG
jgi:hypothetical protein